MKLLLIYFLSDILANEILSSQHLSRMSDFYRNVYIYIYILLLKNLFLKL